jgi:hypothetical protein
MVEGVSEFDNLSANVSDTAADLTQEAEVTAAFLEATQSSGSAPANPELALRLDMITTTLKNIKNAPARAQEVFLSYKQAEQFAINYSVDISTVLRTGLQYGIVIGPQNDPYSIGTDISGGAMRMALPVEGTGPGEYIESKIDKLDAIKNEYYLAHPFESRQQDLYTRDILRDSSLGNALSSIYTEYTVRRSKVERDNVERQADCTLYKPQSVDVPKTHTRSSNWRSSA